MQNNGENIYLKSSDEKYIIEGGQRLSGSVEIQSAKNAVLPIIAGSLLTDKKVVISNCAKISDVENMVDIIHSIGGSAKFISNSLFIDNSRVNSYVISENLTDKMRASVVMLGSILARFRRAEISYPGGCDIGARPINLHLKALRELGVKVFEENGKIFCDAKNFKAGKVTLDFPSVGATENVMLFCAISKGITVIENPAKEPEIVDLQNFLNKMGAKIIGAGGDRIVIMGVNSLNGCNYTPIPDRIEIGTYLIATAICGGKVTLKNANLRHNEALIEKLQNNACQISCNRDKIYINAEGYKCFQQVICTLPYPGFPTDLQPQITVYTAHANGNSAIIENVFENRFRHIAELKKMGADIFVKDNCAFVKGVKRLNGASVKAYDLRGGIAMVIAGMSAKGKTEVMDISHIDRGYQNLKEKLLGLNVKIKRER